MDIALTHNPQTGLLDISLVGGDLLAEDTLATAVMLSLLSDRTAQAHEVDAGSDQRGWWADAFADDDGDQFGSRLWLIGREKVIPATVQLVRTYVQEALQWMVDDGIAESIVVTAFIPQPGWIYCDVALMLNASSRRFRFEWSDEAQVWRLAAELGEVI